MFASMPTPHRTLSPTRHSTYAAARRRRPTTARARRSRAPGRRSPTRGQRVDERRDRAVAGAGRAHASRRRRTLTLSSSFSPRRRRAVRHGAQTRGPRSRYSSLEDLPDRSAADLAALGVGVLLDHPAELDLQPARQVELVLGLQDVGDAALAGLAVDPDDGLVGAADVLRVDRQVRRLPGDARSTGTPGSRPRRLEGLEALLDGVLVGAGERRVDQVAGVGVARVDRQLGAVLDRAADLVDVGEVDLRVDALAEQVHAQRHQVRRCRCARRGRTGSPRPGRRRPSSPARWRRRRCRGRCAGAG